MVFSKDYDKTLWLILYADKNNRYDIANFIRIIPKDLIERIRNVLMNGNISDKIEFSKAIRDDDGILSLFKIKIDKYSLRIQLSIWNNNMESAYDIDLGKIDFSKVNEDDLTYVGSYYYGKSGAFLGVGPTILNADGFGYEMYVNEDNNLMIQVSGSKFLFDYQYDKKINIDMNQVNVELDDLLNNNSVNRLVRGKRTK